MKNFYTAFACAVAVSASAIAAVPAAEKVTIGSFSDLQYLPVTSVMSKNIKKAPMKVAAPTEDIEGYYAVEYIYPFKEGEATKTTAMIEMVDDTQIIITLEPWCSGYTNVAMDGILADYDPATGTITMKCEDNSELGEFTENKGQPGLEKKYGLNLSAQKLVPIPDDPEGNGEWTPIDVVTAVVNEDGTITFGDDDTMWGFGVIGLPGNWVGAFRGAKFVAPDYFNFVESEWNSCGKATFTENWVNNLLTGENEQYRLQPREVDLFNNKANPAMFCVKNPYAEWEVNEDPTATGYIVFDMQNPELIPMRILTESGLWMTMEEGGFPESIMIHNLEGQQHYNNETPIDDLVTLFRQNQIVPSSFDKSTNTVTLKNILFSTSASPAASYGWNSDSDGNWTLKIQASAFAGVENVLDDAENVENAPVRYFNLQGMEVANPEAGQLVIKKQGSKTTKLIVR